MLTRCPGCETDYDVPEQAVGKTTTCKKCGGRFAIHPAPPDADRVTVLPPPGKPLFVPQSAAAPPAVPSAGPARRNPAVPAAAPAGRNAALWVVAGLLALILLAVVGLGAVYLSRGETAPRVDPPEPAKPAAAPEPTAAPATRAAAPKPPATVPQPKRAETLNEVLSSIAADADASYRTLLPEAKKRGYLLAGDEKLIFDSWVKDQSLADPDKAADSDRLFAGIAGMGDLLTAAQFRRFATQPYFVQVASEVWGRCPELRNREGMERILGRWSAWNLSKRWSVHDLIVARRPASEMTRTHRDELYDFAGPDILKHLQPVP